MYRLATLAVLLVASAETAAAQRYTVDRWEVDDGLPNTALSDVIQSRDGYLWIATWAGVVRFDGVRFTPVAEDLPNDHARALFEDRDGAMWIGVSGAGLVRWRAGVVETLTEADGLAGHDVRALAEDGEGRIWAGTENGVSVIVPRPFDASRGELAPGNRRITTYRVEQGLPANDIKGLARGRDGQMWIATAKGVCAATREDLRCERLALFSGSPNAVLEDPLGTAVGRHRRGPLLRGLRPGNVCRPVGQRAPAFESGGTLGRIPGRRRGARRRSRHRAIRGGGRTSRRTRGRHLRGSQRAACGSPPTTVVSRASSQSA